MSLITALKHAYFGPVEEKGVPVSAYNAPPGVTVGTLESYFDHRQPGSNVNFEREAGSLWMSSLVMPHIAWMGRQFPEAPPVVMIPGKDGGEEMETRHDALDLLNAPNPYYQGDYLFGMSILSGIVDGNAYWLKDRDGSGRVTALWYIPHWMMQPYAVGGAYLSGYRYRVGGREYLYRPEDVVHLRFGIGDPNTLGRTAISPLRAQLREIATDNEAAAFTFSVLKNHGFSGGIIAPNKDVDSMTPDQRRAFKTAIVEQTSGDHRGSWVVASDAFQYEVLGKSPNDMVLDKLRGISEARVCAALGVSPMVLGFTAGLNRSTFTNYEEAKKAAYEQAVIPLKKSVARALTEQLVAVDFVGAEDHRLSWDWSGVRCLQEDETDRVKRYVTAAGGPIMTVNEARAEMGMDPIEGQDEIRTAIAAPPAEDPRSKAQKLRDMGYRKETIDLILKERRSFDVIPETEQ